MTDDIEEALRAARDFAAEMSARRPMDRDIKLLVAKIDYAIELRVIEKGVRT